MEETTKDEILREAETKRDELLKEFLSELEKAAPTIFAIIPKDIIETCYKQGFINGMNLSLEVMDKIMRETLSK